MTDTSKEVLYLASKNKHKLEELTAMIGSDFEVRLCTELDPEISWEETGDTFAANAKIKADAVRRLTDCAVLADDSGLEVASLGGAPGVYSSRYAGTDGDDAANNRKLLKELDGVNQREARFVCCLAYVAKDGDTKVFEGYCGGRIIEEARGQHGFGYDPLFAVGGGDRTLAEYSAQEKNTISHRKRALEAFCAEVLG